jgi:hypothetical protein
MKSALVLLMLAACGGRVETQEPQSGSEHAPDPCGPLQRQAANVWCDRGHQFAFYCQASPKPNDCYAAKQSDDGTGDALYCCDPAAF